MISSADPANRFNRAFVEASAILRSPDRPGYPADLASYRIALGSLFQAGLSAFHLIAGHDTAWHTAVFSGEIGHDPADEGDILDRYRTWLEASEALIASIDLAGPIGIGLEVMDEIRTYRGEARGLLTTDADFFEGEALDRLVARAILAEDREETVPLEEISD